MNRSFHIVLYHWDSELPPREPGNVFGFDVELVSLSREVAMEPSQFPVSFEVALENLDSEFNAYTEGDGSFGFAKQAGDESWRVSGTIFETDSKIGCVDFFTTNFPASDFRRFLSALGTDENRSVVQLPDQGVHLTTEQFLRILENDG